MGRIETLNSNLSSVKNNIANAETNIGIYQDEITKLKEKINEVMALLKENSFSDEYTSKLRGMISTGVSDFSTIDAGLKAVSFIKPGSELIDYSVGNGDLIYKDSISINGKTVNVYSSRNTDALYVISNGLTNEERKQLRGELKNHLQEDQMAILTFHGDYYNYDISDRRNCTNDYSVVGKTENGKMYSFTTSGRSEINVDDGGSNDTLMTSINGMVLANRMNMTMEEGTQIVLQTRPKDNINGGRTVVAYTRLTVSGGEHSSVGSEHATVALADDWARYSHIRVNSKKGNYDIVTVGDGPTSTKYTGKFNEYGNVQDKVISIGVEATKAGSQGMQATIEYEHEGSKIRYSHQSKDMLFYPQYVVSDWDNWKKLV